MAKADGPQQETNLSQAGMPPSYGSGILGSRQIGNQGIPLSAMGGGGVTLNSPYGMNSSGPSNNFLQMLFQHMQSGMNGMNQWDRRTNGMGGPRGTGFNFNTPISAPYLFSGMSGDNNQGGRF